ncbi:MAG: hypothetical protein GC160_16240 [Acidobacteria bacterium]|nr:hypothetical protein [Acidobacteriota bacterium]
MKRRNALQNIAAAGLLAVPASAAWKDTFAEQFRKDILGHWANEREYSLAIFDAMPAAKLAYRPGPEVRTFGEQSVHFARAQAAYFSRLNVPGVEAPKALEESEADPAAVRRYIVATYDFIRASLEKMSEQEFLRRDVPLGQNRPLHTTVDMFLRAILHTAHHRGQMVVYLRLNGIVPPTWRFAAQGG